MFQTTADQARAAGRMERKFWAIDSEAHRVVHVSGFSTQNDGYWWVPELGYSMAEGHHLFTDRDAAVAKTVHMIDLAMERLTDARENLTQRTAATAAREASGDE